MAAPGSFLKGGTTQRDARKAKSAKRHSPWENNDSGERDILELDYTLLSCVDPGQPVRAHVIFA
ncbi:hypothetical protein PI124_g16176 [Phytophthora idaei]|nr:hypothetical protein PI124_g16176 [Phytophthora idaei]